LVLSLDQNVSISEDSMFALFNRRSGPIAGAVAVTVEQFNG